MGEYLLPNKANWFNYGDIFEVVVRYMYSPQYGLVYRIGEVSEKRCR